MIKFILTNKKDLKQLIESNRFDNVFVSQKILEDKEPKIIVNYNGYNIKHGRFRLADKREFIKLICKDDGEICKKTFKKRLKTKNGILFFEVEQAFNIYKELKDAINIIKEHHILSINVFPLDKIKNVTMKEIDEEIKLLERLDLLLNDKYKLNVKIDLQHKIEAKSIYLIPGYLEKITILKCLNEMLNDVKILIDETKV